MEGGDYHKTGVFSLDPLVGLALGVNAEAVFGLAQNDHVGD